MTMSRALMAAFLFLMVGCADDSTIDPTNGDGDNTAADFSAAPTEATPELANCALRGETCTNRNGCAELGGRFTGAPCGPPGFACCDTP
jgi:hypothetical protein